jgi:hypothetical protein
MVYFSNISNGSHCIIMHSSSLITNKKFWKNSSPTFLWYDTDRIENDASNNSFLPRERLYQVVT